MARSMLAQRRAIKSAALDAVIANGGTVYSKWRISRGTRAWTRCGVTSGTQRFSKITLGAGYSEETIASPSILMADIAGPSCRQPAENLPSRNRAAPVSIPAMPAPVIVNPTCSGVNRRPPEGTPPVPTDYAPDDQADRPGDHQARAGTENRADVIRVRTRRSKGNHQNRRDSQ